MKNSANQSKILSIVFYQRCAVPDGTWQDTTDWIAVKKSLTTLCAELEAFNIELQQSEDPTEIEIRSYADVLNCVRLRYPVGGFTNTCLGHIIGQSVNCNLSADIKRGVNRMLFAPETIEPQDGHKIVCHNCGCGC